MDDKAFRSKNTKKKFVRFGTLVFDVDLDGRSKHSTSWVYNTHALIQNTTNDILICITNTNTEICYGHEPLVSVKVSYNDSIFFVIFTYRNT